MVLETNQLFDFLSFFFLATKTLSVLDSVGQNRDPRSIWNEEFKIDPM